jgi:hypothetical protein
MSAHRVQIEAVAAWGRRPVYRARIVNSEPARIVVKSARQFSVGQRIHFATLPDLDRIEAHQRAAPATSWRSGVIWRIDKGCLHLTRT